MAKPRNVEPLQTIADQLPREAFTTLMIMKALLKAQGLSSKYAQTLANTLRTDSAVATTRSLLKNIISDSDPIAYIQEASNTILTAIDKLKNNSATTGLYDEFAKSFTSLHEKVIATRKKREDLTHKIEAIKNEQDGLITQLREGAITNTEYTSKLNEVKSKEAEVKAATSSSKSTIDARSSKLPEEATLEKDLVNFYLNLKARTQSALSTKPQILDQLQLPELPRP